MAESQGSALLRRCFDISREEFEILSVAKQKRFAGPIPQQLFERALLDADGSLTEVGNAYVEAAARMQPEATIQENAQVALGVLVLASHKLHADLAILDTALAQEIARAKNPLEPHFRGAC